MSITTISLQPETKTELKRLKKDSKQSDDKLIRSLINSANSTSMTLSYPPNFIYSVSPTSTSSEAVGVGEGENVWSSYARDLKWMQDTWAKMPYNEDKGYYITPKMREQAYRMDPLIQQITEFKKNILLSNYQLITKENKKYEAMLTDMTEFIERTRLMSVLRERYEDIPKHGALYIRKDRNAHGISGLQGLYAAAMMTYQDPFKSENYAYHQRIKISTEWSTSKFRGTDEVNSFFIPGGKLYIPDEKIEVDNAKEIWDEYQKKYAISETARLRVGDAADIICIRKGKINDPAPIDGAIMAIYQKRTIFSNAINIIYSVTNPFLQVKQGMMYEIIDQNGNKEMRSSVPPYPPAGMETTNKEKYDEMLANYNAYVAAQKTTIQNLFNGRIDGGMFASGPDIDIKLIESASMLAPSFISMSINQLNEEIAQSQAFPLALLQARGAELATSDTIKSLHSTSMAGERQDIEQAVLFDILWDEFKGKVWQYEIKNNRTGDVIESGDYTIEDTGLEFHLGEGDKKDALVEAQTRLVFFQSLAVAKKDLGASKSDIQDLLDEAGEGIYELDNFDAQPQNPFSFMGNQDAREEESQGSPITNDLGKGKVNLPSELKKPSVSEVIQSSVKSEAKPDNLKGEDTKMSDELMALYEEAEKAMIEVLTKMKK